MATRRPASPASSAPPPARPDAPGAPAPPIPAPQRFALDGRSRRPDPRTHAYRGDIADVDLAGRVFASHYARPESCACVVPAAMLLAAPDAGARAVSQLLHGEGFAILDIAAGWVWGRCAHDDYVGYVRADALGRASGATHRVTAVEGLVFAAPDLKAPVVARWSLGARFAAGEVEGEYLATEVGFVHRRHAAPIEQHEADPVAVAARLIGQPYLWGGRGAGGVDCSGVVQLALGACGIAAPRDSDMQQAALGRALAEGEALRRGDLVFFPGHVGLMADEATLLHANAYWMAVVAEPLAEVAARIGEGAILARRRIG